MLAELLVFTAFALILAGSAWWTWKERQDALARAQASAELAALGVGVHSIAHDLQNLFTVIVSNLASVSQLSPDEQHEALRDVEAAARSASVLVQAMRGNAPNSPGRPGSAEGVVRLTVALLRGNGVPIDLQIDGDLTYMGQDADAVRLVQNLLFNAVREASHISRARVRVELDRRGLRVRNPVRDPSQLDSRIYEEGVSHSGSSGKGLAIARRAAEQLSWVLRHEVHGMDVVFYVEPRVALDTAAE
jgi:signal transduction histidine kinase